MEGPFAVTCGLTGRKCNVISRQIALHRLIYINTTSASPLQPPLCKPVCSEGEIHRSSLSAKTWTLTQEDSIAAALVLKIRLAKRLLTWNRIS